MISEKMHSFWENRLYGRRIGAWNILEMDRNFEYKAPNVYMRKEELFFTFESFLWNSDVSFGDETI